MRLRERYLLTMTGLVMCITLTLIVLFSWQFRTSLSELTEDSSQLLSQNRMMQTKIEGKAILQTLLMQIAKPLYKNEMYTVHALLDGTEKHKNMLHVVLFDTKGNILHSNNQDNFTVNHSYLDPTSLKNLQNPGHYLVWREADAMLFNVPISYAGKVIGGLTLGLELSDIDIEIAQIQQHLHTDSQRALNKHVLTMSFSGLLLLLISAALVWFITQRLTRPIQELVQQAEQIGRGDFSIQLQQSRNDEIGDLQKAFISMGKNLQEHADLRRAKQAAEEACQAKNDFLATVSHELRTPMNGVLGMTELLINTPLNQQQQEFAQTISRSGKHLFHIINNMLDFSKIDSGQVQQHQQTLAIYDYLEALIAEFAKKAQQQNLRLQLYIAPEIPEQMQLDAEHLQQVLRHLLNNALKFTQTGEVLLELTLAESENKLAILQDEIQFAVIDTGIGISHLDYEKIFHPFAQVDNSITRKYDGTGLGLAIAHRLLALMGSQLRLDSTLGKGSCFYFKLPLQRAADDEPYQPSFEPALQLIKQRLLLIDTHPSTCRVISRYAESWGLLIDCCQSIPQALYFLQAAQHQERTYQWVLADTELEDDQGQCLLKRLTEEFQAHKLGLIGLSINNSAKQQTSCSIQCQQFLHFPILRQALHTVLLNALNHTPAHTAQLSPPQKILTSCKPEALLAEDNRITQLVLEHMLTSLGYSLTIVQQGQEAVSRLENGEHYDVLLIEAEMPDMSSLEAVQRIRAYEDEHATPRMPVISLVAEAADESLQQENAAGVTAFLPKPFSQHQLEQALRQCSGIKVHSGVS